MPNEDDKRFSREDILHVRKDSILMGNGNDFYTGQKIRYASAEMLATSPRIGSEAWFKCSHHRL